MGILDQITGALGSLTGLGPDPRSQIPGLDQGQFNLPGFQGLQDRALGFGGAQIDPSRFSGQQDALLSQLQASAQGQGVAQQVAQRQLQDAFARASAQQQAGATSARGVDPGLANLQAGANTANIQSGLAGQNAALALAGQQQAQQQLGGALGVFGGQELQRQQAQAGFGQQAALQGQDLAARLAQLQQQGQIGFQNAEQQRALALQGLAGPGDQLLKTAATIGGLALSDRTKKTNIKSGDAEADDFLKKLRAHTFKFKDQNVSEGKQLGVMAQDLEKSKAGKRAVVQTPEGKKVDLNKLTQVLAASVGRMSKRLAKLESEAQRGR